MIHNIIKFLGLVFIVVPSFTYSQSDISSEYEMCIIAMDLIRNNDIEGFTELIDETVMQEVDNISLTSFVNQASQVLIKYANPVEEYVLVNQSSTTYKGKEVIITGLSIPFPPTVKPGTMADQYIIFHFSKDIQKDKIVGFRIKDFIGPGKQIEEDAKSKPHLDQFELDEKNLSWMRIWYDRGLTENEFGDDSGVYALSGNSKILKNAGIDVLVSEIFSLINCADIDSTDYKYNLRKAEGNSEFVYLRLKLENYPYPEYHEFSIFTIITSDKNIAEYSDGYIVIKHSRVFRYFLKIENNQELFNKLVKLAHMDHGDLVEKMH